MGLLALLIVGGTPLLEWFAGPASATLLSLGAATRLGFAICNVLLLENLYFNTPAESRWHINLLCVALGGVFLYDLLLYADGVAVPPRCPSRWSRHARRPSCFAAPLIALAAARNRRWAVDIHVSRDVVFHSATLVVSGIFLLGARPDRRSRSAAAAPNGARVAEVSLMFGGILAVGVALTSASARSRIRAMVVENFFSNRYDYRTRMDALHRDADRAGSAYRAAQPSDPCGGGGRGQPGRRAVRACPRGGRVPMGRFLEHAGGHDADPAGPSRWSREFQRRRLDRRTGRACRRGRLVRRTAARPGSPCRSIISAR